MKNNLLKTLLSATLLLGTVNNASYTMEDINNYVEYTNEEKQNIRQTLLDKYKDELNEWDENFKNSLNQLNTELTDIASKIDSVVEENNIIIGDNYTNSNAIQNSDIYNAYITKIEKLIILDQLTKTTLLLQYSNIDLNNNIQSTSEYLNNVVQNLTNGIFKQKELDVKIKNAYSSLHNIQYSIQCSKKNMGAIQHINILQEKYSKLKVEIENMEKEYTKINNSNNKLKEKQVLFYRRMKLQEIEQNIFDSILDEHYNAHVNSININKYEQLIRQYFNKLVYISQYVNEYDIKNWGFNQGNI